MNHNRLHPALAGLGFAHDVLIGAFHHNSVVAGAVIRRQMFQAARTQMRVIRFDVNLVAVIVLAIEIPAQDELVVVEMRGGFGSPQETVQSTKISPSFW